MTIDEQINEAGEVGSLNRLRAISRLCWNTRRGEAAAKAIQRRYARMDYMERGFTLEEAILMVNRNDEL